MAITGLVPILIFSFQNHYFAKKAIEKLEKDHLNYSLKSRMLWLREWLRHSKKEFNRIAGKVNIQDGTLSANNKTIIKFAADTLFKGHASYKSLTIFDHNWNPISQFPDDNYIPPLSEAFKKKFRQDTLLVTSNPYISLNDKSTILPLGQTLIDRRGLLSGFIVAELNVSRSLNRILADTSDLDESGKLYLVTADGNILFSSSPSQEDSPPEQSLISPDILKTPYWKLKKHYNSQGISVFFIAADIPEMNWILIVEIEKIQVLKEFQRYILYGGITALFILLLILLFAHKKANSLSTPIDEFATLTRHIAAGNYQERLPEFQDRSLNEAVTSLNNMLDTIEDAKKNIIQATSLSAVGKLSSSIVHEMRNPLSSVKINLQALARKVKNDPAYSEMAAIALTQVKRLESMFTELLNFSKPIDLTPENVSFELLANEVLEILTQKAADKIISIEISDNLDSSLIKVDKQHMLLALLNLVDNAIQWSPSESIIHLTADKLPDNEGFIITVRDSGKGLREDQMAKLFQPFYTTREKGTGLGLANVKKIVEFHGGTVSASNSPLGGAQFSMIFKGRLT